jgi:hypothetical protein
MDGRPRHPAPLPPALALAWSVSRHHMLATCERQVFWHYFGSRGAGLAVDDPEAVRDAELAWALRHLTDVPRLIGTAVHQAARRVVEAVIAGGPPPSYSALLAAARFSLNQAWTNSQPAEVDRFWRYPTTYVVLRELALRGELHDFEIEVARMRLRRALSALVNAPVLRDLRVTAARDADDVFLPPAGAPLPFTTHLPATDGDVGAVGEATAWAAVDVAYLHRDLASVAEALVAQTGGDLASLPPWRRGPAEQVALAAARARLPQRPVWCVTDFKTGAHGDSEAERLQLGTYALWLESAGYPATDGIYLGRIVDLSRAEDRWYVLDRAVRDGARDVMAADLARQGALMMPPPAGASGASATPRPMAAWRQAGNRTRCLRCSFAVLCAREWEPAPAPGAPAVALSGGAAPTSSAKGTAGAHDAEAP